MLIEDMAEACEHMDRIQDSQIHAAQNLIAKPRPE